MTIYRSALAEADLIDIWLFIARDNPKAADRLIDQIHQKLKTIAKKPSIGRLCEQLSPGLRSFPFGKYLIFYQPVPDGILVVRVLSGYRDVVALFEKQAE